MGLNGQYKSLFLRNCFDNYTFTTKNTYYLNFQNFSIFYSYFSFTLTASVKKTHAVNLHKFGIIILNNFSLDVVIVLDENMQIQITIPGIFWVLFLHLSHFKFKISNGTPCFVIHHLQGHNILYSSVLKEMQLTDWFLRSGQQLLRMDTFVRNTLYK